MVLAESGLDQLSATRLSARAARTLRQFGWRSRSDRDQIAVGMNTQTSPGNLIRLDQPRVTIGKNPDNHFREVTEMIGNREGQLKPGTRCTI